MRAIKDECAGDYLARVLQVLLLCLAGWKVVFQRVWEELAVAELARHGVRHG